MQTNLGQKFITKIFSEAENNRVVLIENESSIHLAIQYDSERYLQFAFKNKTESNWNIEQRFFAKHKAGSVTLIGLKDLPAFIFDYEMNCIL